MPQKPIGPLCKRPFPHASGMVHGCDQCLPCLIKRRRIWSSRIMLESFKHGANAFVTLTYSDGKPDRRTGKIITRKDGSPALPPGGTLVKKDYQDFLKRLRANLDYRSEKFGLPPPSPIRYYFTGEYGEENGRPHYHAALFGVGPEDEAEIAKAWYLGHVYVGDLTHDSAQYIAGYVTKKMTHPESKCTPQCKHPPLAGRLPEFSKPSLGTTGLGGIGAPAMSDLMDVLTTGPGCDSFASLGDVPYFYMMGKKAMPLGRYMRQKLRKKMGIQDGKMPLEAYHAYKAEMQKLQKDYVETSEDSEISKYLDSRSKYQKWLIDKCAQKVLQLEKKNKIYSVQRNKV